ncbi:hypothetical protein F5Y10DRAFT_285309 [Nemania abortiva]|nr:hypothetical protein F5Y10DRAFT_285309 [Nemania abortiva]
MAGLPPSVAQAIAQLVVRHIGATGACVIDLPAAAPALDMCTSIEIRVPEQQHVIERHTDSICIRPSTPMAVDQGPPRAERPPPAHPPPPANPGNGCHCHDSPWRTSVWPMGPGPGDRGGPGGHGGGGGGHEWMPPGHGGPPAGGGGGGQGWMPPEHGGHGGGGGHGWMPPGHGGPPKEHPPPAPAPIKEEPPTRPDPPARPDGPRPAPGRSPLQPATIPDDKGGDDGSGDPGGPPSPLLPSPTPLALPPAQSSDPEPPGFVKVSTSLPPPPPTSTLQSTLNSTPTPSSTSISTLTSVSTLTSTPTPTPSLPPPEPSPIPPPERPVEPSDPEPPAPDPPPASMPPPDPAPPPPPPPPSRPSSPPPSPPAPAPAVCESAYATIDVSELSGVNPHSYGQYLSLLGHHHHDSDGMPRKMPRPNVAKHKHHGHENRGITLVQGKKDLVHQYRVRCGVQLPNGPQPVFPGFGGGEEHSRVVNDGHWGCLETCEREAIAMAAQGLLTECLGVAYRDLVGDVLGAVSGNGEGNGECRFWYGDGREAEFLPVHSLPNAGADADRWQILYM